MSSCDTHLLSLYLDGELALPDRVGLEQHLQGCGPCRDELDEMRRIDADIAAWGRRRLPVPAASEQRTFHAVAERHRLGPLASLGRITPAAVGTSVAALLLFVSANADLLSPRAAATAVSVPRQTAQYLRQPSDPVLKAQRMSVIVFPQTPPTAARNHPRLGVD